MIWAALCQDGQKPLDESSIELRKYPSEDTIDILCVSPEVYAQVPHTTAPRFSNNVLIQALALGELWISVDRGKRTVSSVELLLHKS